LDDAGTVFPKAQLSDDWGSIIVAKGVLLSKDYRHAYVSMPTSPDGRSGDGWKLTLNAGWAVTRTAAGSFIVSKQ
jgi:hypothetical protein